MIISKFDEELIRKVRSLERYAFRQIDDIIWLADTAEAAEILRNIRWENYDLVRETI